MSCWRHSTPFGMPGRAAGVQDVQVIGGVLHRRRRRRTGCHGLLVIHRAVNQVVAGVVGDLDQDA